MTIISIFSVKNIWLSNVSCNRILFFWLSYFQMPIVGCEVWKSLSKYYNKNIKELTLKNWDCTSSYSRSCFINHKNTGWRSISKLTTMFCYKISQWMFSTTLKQSKRKRGYSNDFINQESVECQTTNTVGSCVLILF